MKIRSIRKPKTFVPEFYDNKELPESEQVVVTIKNFPTISESQSYKGYKMSEGGGIELTYPNDAVMLNRHIGAIKNVEIDEEYEAVTSGSTLAKSKCLELAPLIAEIRNFLTETAENLSEGEE